MADGGGVRGADGSSEAERGDARCTSQPGFAGGVATSGREKPCPDVGFLCGLFFRWERGRHARLFVPAPTPSDAQGTGEVPRPSWRRRPSSRPGRRGGGVPGRPAGWATPGPSGSRPPGRPWTPAGEGTTSAQPSPPPKPDAPRRSARGRAPDPAPGADAGSGTTAARRARRRRALGPRTRATRAPRRPRRLHSRRRGR